MTKTDYIDMLKKRIRQTLKEWSSRSSVEENEIYLFLHNLTGTAGTLGMTRIEQWAEGKMDLFSNLGTRRWRLPEWGEQLLVLNELCDDLPEELKGLEEASFPQSPVNHSDNKVLIIDEDINHCIFVKETLEKQSYSVNIALTIERGLKLFYDWSPHLVLLNLAVSTDSGFELLNPVMEKAKQSHIPVIITSARPSKQNQIRAYQFGAMDFFPTFLDAELLTALLDNRMQMKREWERSIHTDELTGAYNRKHCNQVLQQIISEYTRTGQICSLALMDLDHFKQVNDTYGHLKGDEVLRKFVAVAKEIIRDMGILCRYGGEEFVLILPNADGILAASMLQRIRDEFSSHEFESETEPFHVTFSAGVTEVAKLNNHPEKLIEEADLALYAGKRSGRNQTVVYHDTLLAGSKDAELHIIVVDDDVLIRKLVVSELSSWNPFHNTHVIIQEFEDGNMFLNSGWYKHDEKYIILLDGMMPGLDGVDVLKRISTDYPETGIQIIMLTARNNQEDIVQALQIGADDYMVKPFHMPELISRIERLAKQLSIHFAEAGLTSI